MQLTNRSTHKHPLVLLLHSLHFHFLSLTISSKIIANLYHPHKAYHLFIIQRENDKSLPKPFGHERWDRFGGKNLIDGMHLQRQYWAGAAFRQVVNILQTIAILRVNHVEKITQRLGGQFHRVVIELLITQWTVKNVGGYLVEITMENKLYIPINLTFR